jgi:hypothetical protein
VVLLRGAYEMMYVRENKYGNHDKMIRCHHKTVSSLGDQALGVCASLTETIPVASNGRVSE